MAKYVFYDKNTGKVLSEHYGHPHDKDPLTEEKQKKLLLSSHEETFYITGILVNEGFNAKFFPDVLEQRQDGKYVKLDKI